MSRVPFQYLIILAIAFVLFVAWDSTQRLALTWRQDRAEQDLDQRLAKAEATRAALRERKKYVQSDLFIEGQARDRHWVRDGEMLVIPMITPAAPPPVSTLVPAPPPPEPSWWENLFNFLFGP